MSSQDMRFNGSIFRKDFPIILSSNRHLATILPVRLYYQATDMAAGTVLAQYTSGPRINLYDAYSNGGASGMDTAICILFEDAPNSDFANSSDTQLYRGIFGGEVFYNKLTGLDSNAITNLKARAFTDSEGEKILKF